MDTKIPKFDWLATECAPRSHPMRIVQGTLFFHGLSEGLYVPSGGTICAGWGEMISSHVVGDDLKPLPDRLEITFFSCLENAFYHGVFDLPYTHILELFERGYYSPTVESNATYQRIMCGVAPGGTVAVWLLGPDKTDEVFVGQARKTDLDWETTTGLPSKYREQYVKESLANCVDESVRISNERSGIAFADWLSQFRLKYLWEPTFVGSNVPKIINDIYYVNGERGYLPFPLDSLLMLPVPRELAFVIGRAMGLAHLFVIHFNEEEIVNAFSRLGSHQETLQLEFEPQYPVGNTQIRLRNQDEVIILNRYTIEELDE